MKKLDITIPTDMDRLEIEDLARNKRELYKSTVLLITRATGLLEHEIKTLSNEELTYIVDKITRKMRQADEKRWGK